MCDDPLVSAPPLFFGAVVEMSRMVVGVVLLFQCSLVQEVASLSKFSCKMLVVHFWVEVFLEGHGVAIKGA